MYIILYFIIIPQYLDGVNCFFAKIEEKRKIYRFLLIISANHLTNNVYESRISVKIIISKENEL